MNTRSRYCYQHPHPAVTTDVALFAIRQQRLQLLLIKRMNAPYRGMWALPGGFLDIEEDLEHCARRELLEETGIANSYLEQLYTFGSPGRDPRERVISVAYLALLRQGESAEPAAASDAAAARWFSPEQLPALAFDHQRIVAMAWQRLRDKLSYTTLGFQFMAETFTLGELQTVYEAVQSQPLDKRNFRRRMLAQGQIEETGRTRRNGKHRPAREYRIRHPQRVEHTDEH